MHRILRQALDQAVRWELIVATPPTLLSRRRSSAKMEDVRRWPRRRSCSTHFRQTRMFVPVVLGALCGLRRGEMTALRWRAVDLDAGQLAIVESTEQTKAGTARRRPKSGRARTGRPPLAVSRGTARAPPPAGRGAAEARRAPDGRRHVFTQADGRPLQPNSLTHEFVRILALTALPRVRFHDLRHSHATHMLASGVHPKIAQERLGHSSVGITLDLYSHVMPGMQEDAAAKVDAALRAAIDKARPKTLVAKR